MESERKAFNRDKSQAGNKLSNIGIVVKSNNETIARVHLDHKNFTERVQVNKDGENLNPIMLNGVSGSDPKRIGAKLAQLDSDSRTQGEYFQIGSLYGFKLLVKTEKSSVNTDGLDLVNNRFFIEGDGNIKYNYNSGNMANDPKLATLNFLNALERILPTAAKYETENARLLADIPIIKSMSEGVWKREIELKKAKEELFTIERVIQITLSEKEKENKPPSEDQSKDNEVVENQVAIPVIPIKNTPAVNVQRGL